jgi:uncharacterized membrane protein
VFPPLNIAEFIAIDQFLPSVHGGADAAGGGLIGLLDKLLESASRGMEPGGSLQLLPGIQVLGFNVHPSLVHFPIAFLTAFFLLELLGTLLKHNSLRTSASAMLYCGAVGAVLAAAAGLYAASAVTHGQAVHEIMEWHEHIGLTVAGLALILSTWRLLLKHPLTGMAQALHLFLAGIMAAGIVFGADLGGLMVYQHGVAVQSLQQNNAHHHAGDSLPAQTGQP